MATSLLEKNLTRQTMAAVKSAVAKATTAGFTTQTGASGVDLAPFVSLTPVDTPFYNSTPRVGLTMGSYQTMWQTYPNVNGLQSYGFTAPDTSARVMLNSVQTQANPFAKTAIRQVITLDEMSEAMGYVDAYSFAILQMINQKIVQEDILMLNGLTFSIGSVATPVLTASATGGQIGSGVTVAVQVAARSGLNYYAGGSTAATSSVNIVTGTTDATNSVSATLTKTPNLAAAYDWFVGGFYYGTTTLPSITITYVPTANQPVTLNATLLPQLANAGSVAITSVPSTDTSYSTQGFTGLMGTILADLTSSGSASAPAIYASPGTGVSQGAYQLNLAGGQLTSNGPQIDQFNEAFQAIYANYQLSPTRILMAPQQFTDISTAILATANAVNYFDPTSVSQHRGLVAAGSVPIYVNPTTGAAAVLQVMPHLPPGQIAIVCDEVPFPASNIASALQVRTTYDNFLYTYGVTSEPASGPSGPRWDVEVRSNESLENYAAPTMAVITGIAPGVAA
jgi:hypothetical protein